ESQRREARHLDGDSQFLLELANERVFRSLAGLDLPAGELPQPRHHSAGRTLGNEHASVGIDEGAGGDKDKIDAHDPYQTLPGPTLRPFQRALLTRLYQRSLLLMELAKATNAGNERISRLMTGSPC